MDRPAPSRRAALGAAIAMLAAFAGAAAQADAADRDGPTTAVPVPDQAATADVRALGRVAPRRGELAPAIYFDRNSTELRPDAIPPLERWAAYLTRRSPEDRVRLQGHSDDRGTPAYNRVLAEQRALAVFRALVALGVQGDRLEVVSSGEHSPQAFGRNEFAWSRNRRVELELERPGRRAFRVAPSD